MSSLKTVLAASPAVITGTLVPFAWNADPDRDPLPSAASCTSLFETFLLPSTVEELAPTALPEAEEEERVITDSGCCWT